MILCEKEIRRFLTCQNNVSFEIFDTLDSTNVYLKSRAESGAPEGLIALADTQTSGKGRMGRAFLSPDGSGIYISLLLRPTERACNGVLITACAAVAVSEAIEAVTGIKTDIKWVNDLYLCGKKVCGILAEGAISKSGNGFEYAVLGIGVNLIDCFKGTEIEDIASGLYSSLTKDELNLIRHKLISEITNRFFNYYNNGIDSCKNELLQKYRKRLFIVGKQVEVISYTDVRDATVIALNDDFTLKVRYIDGSEESLNSGEVRLKIK